MEESGIQIFRVWLAGAQPDPRHHHNDSGGSQTKPQLTMLLAFHSPMSRAIRAFLCAQFVLTLASTSTNAQDNVFPCDDLVVAGAGPGGLYSAWRLIEAGLVDPSKTCIFEQTHRIGKWQ